MPEPPVVSTPTGGDGYSLRKHALISGGTGFIGHHLIDYLLDETDWRLTALDSLTYAGNPDKVRLDPRLRIVYHDLRAPLDPERTGPVDYVFNLASSSHVEHSITAPAPFIANNVAIATTMLDWARQVMPELFIQFSTDEVYGPAPEGIEHAEWSTILPSNPYAASKAAQEAIAIAYWRTYDVPLVITNTMNVFGENQHPEKFVPKVAEHVRVGAAVPIHGEQVNGEWRSGSRHWVYARDVAEAMHFIATHVMPERYPSTDRPTRYNVVGTEEANNYDLASRIADVLGKPLHVEWVDFHRTRPGHDRRYALDGRKLAQRGWTPRIGVTEGLRRTVTALAP
jgi:dTDP-glucose 4,6-dehydratase